MTAPFSGGTYGSGISRSSTQPDALVPQPYVDEVIQTLPQYSTVMALANVRQMSALTDRQPVLSALPVATWTNSSSTAGGGDYGLVTTSSTQWQNSILTAEELSVIVPIPKAYLADAQIDVWGQVRPLLLQALGKAIDAAALFGTSMPTSWNTTSIYGGANANGNVVASTAFTVTNDVPTKDYGLGFALAGQKLGAQGFSVNGSVAAPGFGFAVAAVRGSTGVQLYPDAAQAASRGDLFGYSYREVKNGSWNASNAALIVGEWDKAVLGIRQDMEFEMFTEGVIQDNTGAIVLNLMQESSVALKCTARIGFVTANPVTPLTSVHGTSFPFAIVSGDSSLT